MFVMVHDKRENFTPMASSFDLRTESRITREAASAKYTLLLPGPIERKVDCVIDIDTLVMFDVLMKLMFESEQLETEFVKLTMAVVLFTEDLYRSIVTYEFDVEDANKKVKSGVVTFDESNLKP